MWQKKFILCILLIIKFINAGEVGDSCTPDENIKNGICKLVEECEAAVRLIVQQSFHSYSRCGFSGNMEIVCCPIDKVPAAKTTAKPTTVGKAIDKFGDTSMQVLRVADIECQRIVNTTLPPLGLHILGGELASLGEFPHMVSLGYERSDEYQFLCGGSLISSTYVLTAAHCVDTLDRVTPSIARMGVVDIEEKQFNPITDSKIEEIIKHPEYMRRTKYHDLTLLRLEKPVKFNSNLSPICLYTNENDPKIALTVTGWGKTSTTRDTKSTILLKANVTAVPVNKCGEMYMNWRKLPSGITSGQICAGDPEGKRDTCQGDSGGPLQGLTGRDGQFRLVGVTSFGRGCGSPGVPGVYTRVAHYLSWIEAIVWPDNNV